MRNITKLLAVFVLLLVTFSPQTSASAEISRYEGRNAWASFYSVDSSGCIRTIVEIDTGEETLYTLAIYKSNSCLGQGLFAAYGTKSLSKSEVEFIGDLDSVRLTTTVTVTDFERGLSFEVFVDLTWTGTGDIVVYQNHNHYRPWPGCTMNEMNKERYREGQVSGTISDGTTNFIPEPAQNVYLNSWKRTSTQSPGCE